MKGSKKREETSSSMNEVDSTFYSRDVVEFDEIPPVSLMEESLKGRIINLETLFPVWDDESIETEDFASCSDDNSFPRTVRYPHIITPHEFKSLGSLLSPEYDVSDNNAFKGKLIYETAA